MADKKEVDSHSGVETTGHEWDGIKELNNPAPRWWLWVLYVTIIWSIGYWVIFPAWPTLSGAGERGGTKGSREWTQYKKLAEEQAEITARRGEFAEKIKAASLEDIQKNPELYAFAVAGGKAMFKENCAACHGTGAQGGNGYPSLVDDDWIWAGDISGIYHTLKVGVRSGHADTRSSAMPAYGKDGMLNAKQIEAVASHVLTLSGNGEANAEGAELFKQNCAACHGESGTGNREMGAPNLADAIWLYGGEKADIAAQVNNPRQGVMPSWESRLPEATIKQLAVYVHSLGGGESTGGQPAAADSAVANPEPAVVKAPEESAPPAE
jgi:cytochrome c oxidase cbb3-type subunit 3